MEKNIDDVCRNRTEGEQESVDENWEDLVKPTTSAAEKRSSGRN